MKIDKLKNLAFTNILSLLGYIYLIDCIWLDYFQIPAMWKAVESSTKYDHEIDGMVTAMIIVNGKIATIVIAGLIFLAISGAALFEYFLQRKKIIPMFKTPDNKVYKNIFIIGLFLQLTPIISFLYKFVVYIFSEIFKSVLKVL